MKDLLKDLKKISAVYGSYTYVKMYDDGSGTIYSAKGVELTEVVDIKEFIKNLNQKETI